MYICILFLIYIISKYYYLRSYGCVLFEMIKLERLFKENSEYLLMKPINRRDLIEE